MRRLLLTPLAVCLAAAVACRRADPDRAALEKQFEESLTGATLVGSSTRGSKPGLSEEKYTIQKVSKLQGDTWLFHARIQYGSRDVTVPIPLTVKWAGDTPVVTLTDLSIPGLGTYTARVMFFRGQYAGTWQAKDHGGVVFGRITR
jgi:hypothetical protein